ncbi:MAG: type II toxin-antitoxin system RelE/ParE family toxin [Elusimicrobia bacterium]|nr:type II toxin-antitoxin system RelE/ParE family toxin [Elusimicrobiota bacterium]
MTKILRYYRTPDGTVPFQDWIASLKDAAGRFIILRRIDRAAKGNLGDFRTVGGGIIELRVDFGPGYRVYAGLSGEELIILLCGGNKKSQDRDIANAHEYWADHRSRK